jgi:hypothetical protein
MISFIILDKLKKYPRKIKFIVLTEEELIKKIAAMESYIFEKRDFPHPRSGKSIRNRAQMWGIAVGAEFAEPFQIIRIVE